MIKILSLDDKDNNNLSREGRRGMMIDILLSFLYYTVFLRVMFGSCYYCFERLKFRGVVVCLRLYS